MAFLLISGGLAIAAGLAARYWAQRRADSDPERRAGLLGNPMILQGLVFGILIIVVAVIYGASRWG